MTPPLPIRPLPKADENAIGYIIRLAKSNHFRNLSEFLKAYASKALPSQYNTSSLLASITLASKLTGHDLIDKDYPIVSGDWANDPEVDASKRFTFSRKPCICPHCVREDGYLKSNWQYTVNSYCEKHQCAHINVCPSCNKELVWNVQLLNLTCQRCGSALSSEQVDEPVHIRKLNAMDDTEKWKFAATLRELALDFMRPFDLMKKRIGEAPVMTGNWNDLYADIAKYLEKDLEKPTAYALLSSGDSRYKEYIQSPLSIGMRQAIKRTPTNIECRNFMDNEALDRWFGISSYHMQACLDMKYAKVLFKKPYCGTCIYDFHDWKLMFKKFRRLEGKGTDITEVASDAPVFWCHEEEVVVGVLRGRIPVKFKNPDIPNFNEAWVDRDAAYYYLRKQKTLTRGAAMTIEQVSLALGIKPKEVRLLVKNKTLEEYTTTSKLGLLSVESVRRAVEQFDFPNRKKIINQFPSINFSR